MHVLVVQNYEGTGLGQVGAALNEAGAQIDIRNAHLGDSLPDDATGHDALVVLGGGQNALADDDYPYIPSLLDLMRDFERRDRAVLGICLGSQLLARAYGAENLIGASPEFGWHQIELRDEAIDDPVLSRLPRQFTSFQWHDDTFTLPEGAVHLAANAATRHQAFRIGRAAYGFQFHFEADQVLVRQWNVTFADMIARSQPNWFGRFESEEARHAREADAAGMALARAWVAAI
ncbi:MAG: type 1 glutamine amidotransferase [Pseudaminobacter sp.]